MGMGDARGKSDVVVTYEVLKEKEKGIWSWVHNKIPSINQSQRSGLESSEFRKSFSRDSMKRLS